MLHYGCMGAPVPPCPCRTLPPHVARLPPAFSIAHELVEPAALLVHAGRTPADGGSVHAGINPVYNPMGVGPWMPAPAHTSITGPPWHNSRLSCSACLRLSGDAHADVGGQDARGVGVAAYDAPVVHHVGNNPALLLILLAVLRVGENCMQIHGLYKRQTFQGA
eukprot:366190-Chlamydomonas_euryale.AAC.9